ncbi:hypothetical protein Ahy_A01g003265 [Arachis hypogaea]|uniref:Uncharacterized protein n=1 Tax=Arachis hypogaea TaxID=3818 RepID=A0A445ESI3_ARAHY|nr:hypothetical protein Ahy_A01g003265 [Arachis hypogaea]
MVEFMDEVTIATVRQPMKNIHMLGTRCLLTGTCVGEVRKLAIGRGHLAVLTNACSLKELCEFIPAETMILSDAAKVEDVASRIG